MLPRRSRRSNICPVFDARTGELSSAPRDQHWLSVELLVGADAYMAGGTGFDLQDESTNGYRLTRTQSATTIDTSFKKFGAGSAKFTGANGVDCWGCDVVDPSELAWNQDFTIELWLSRAGTIVDKTALSTYMTGTTGWTLGGYTGEKIYFNASGDGYDLQGTTALSLNTFYHVCVQNISNVLYLHISGVPEASKNISGMTGLSSGRALYVGRFPEFTQYNWNGHMDEIRITRGVARYGTGSFSVPTAAFPRTGP